MKAWIRAAFVKPSTAWLLLFFPALSYFVGTRLRSLGLFRSSTYGHPIPSKLLFWSSSSSTSSSSDQTCPSNNNNNNNNNKNQLVYLKKDCQTLLYPIYIVQDDFNTVVSTTWRDDEDLGRGYILISTSGGNGKIFRWETGGGPIAIGRTLSLTDSGCRSNHYRDCTTSPPIITSENDSASRSRSSSAGDVELFQNNFGSGGIVIDTHHQPPRIIVAEWGEGRISRLEENGARTPLVIEVPTTTTTITGSGSDSISQTSVDGQDEVSSKAGYERLVNPIKLLMTPYGDLMILDSRCPHRAVLDEGCGRDDIVWRLQKAVKIPSLPSLPVSREAHYWDRLLNHSDNGSSTGQQQQQQHHHQQKLPHSFFQSKKIGGMVVDVTGQRLYVTTKQGTKTVVVSLSLFVEDYDAEESVSINLHPQNGETINRELKQKRHSALVLDYSDYARTPGAIEIDNNGNLYLVIDDGILIVAKSLSEKVTISFLFAPLERVVDLTLGSDKFLYIATETTLARLRVPNKPLEVPTDFLIKA
jgi:hypothetical protein